jgi:hypothetical protein
MSENNDIAEGLQELYLEDGGADPPPAVGAQLPPPPHVAGQHHHSPALQLPSFWTDSPSAWFGLAESRFRMRHINNEWDRFDAVVSALPKDTLRLVLSAVTDPDEHMPYMEPALNAHGVQAYLAGHVHDFQHLAEKNSAVNYFISGAGAFSSAFEDAIVRGARLSEVLKGLLQDMTRIIARRTITEPLGNAASAGLSSIGAGNWLNDIGTAIGGLFRAEGGPVAAGQPYIVGERGPEWFVPNQAGTVLPNGSAPAGTTINTSIAIDARGADAGVEATHRHASRRLPLPLQRRRSRHPLCWWSLILPRAFFVPGPGLGHCTGRGRCLRGWARLVPSAKLRKRSNCALCG